MALVEFKEFVKKNPSLVKYVKNNEMTWQKFYEMYDLYGEDENTWKDYLDIKNETEKLTTGVVSGIGFNEIINWLKNVNLDGLQEGISNVQRVLGVVSDLGKKENNSMATNEYKPRPLYKHFED